MRHYKTLFSHHNIVPDLHQVIDLCASANNCRAERPAVDGDVRANLHVILDDDMPNLRDFAVNAAVHNVTKAVGAEDRAGMDAHPPANLGLRIEHDVGEKLRLLSNDAIVSNMIAATQDGLRANEHILANDAAGTNVRAGIHSAPSGSRLPRDGFRGGKAFREKKGQDASEGHSGVGDTDQNFSRILVRPINQNRGGGALFGFAKELFTFGKGQVASFGGVGGCKAGQRRGAIAHDFSLEFFGNLRGGKCVHSGFGWLKPLADLKSARSIMGRP